MKQKALPELDILGWSGAELARRIGTTDRTVSRWRTGKAEPPGSVTEYLNLAVFIDQKGYKIP